MNTKDIIIYCWYYLSDIWNRSAENFFI